MFELPLLEESGSPVMFMLNGGEEDGGLEEALIQTEHVVMPRIVALSPQTDADLCAGP